MLRPLVFLLFFFNDTATTEIYTLSLHDALPIYRTGLRAFLPPAGALCLRPICDRGAARGADHADDPRGQCAPQHDRSEEHTSELQSHLNLVCRLLLEKKKP